MCTLQFNVPCTSFPPIYTITKRITHIYFWIWYVDVGIIETEMFLAHYNADDTACANIIANLLGSNCFCPQQMVGDENA